MITNLATSNISALLPDLGKPPGLEFLEKSSSDKEAYSGSDDETDQVEINPDKELSDLLSKVPLADEQHEESETDNDDQGL